MNWRKINLDMLAWRAACNAKREGADVSAMPDEQRASRMDAARAELIREGFTD